ncbi:hypothetical protein M272_05135 [Vibrio natriegens NBRC 15636 = ATCC 14048 = DSM 759]|jgi:hypothetical protein|uniref:Uncharacterized protein n=1 Tax=Vibrio natriegens NBRC 15636 = ATCC 14048 = DSM 759 TaxID=1219067 RepID=A0AAN0Y2F1_VIBNA|nr:hypothetical protein PN96_04825 [Vibrio natriegens NBRC 15636 = ATCC 14048 = DSM 759]ANQ12807.1 hypothetical protein BA890_08505 [Vibrio natriegens NBRC 15636 = ATCC 14048 = DSM 759]EPM38418.1 hypothetical protein M272_05135 [Vibrio natriegens NBRC 15636 = ATCC 14048 = DSM 759]
MYVSLSKAAHQPSSSLIMVSPPYWSREMNCSGTPVSEMIMTSRRQQHALQFEQDGASGEVFLIGIFMGNYNFVNCA